MVASTWIEVTGWAIENRGAPVPRRRPPQCCRAHCARKLLRSPELPQQHPPPIQKVPLGLVPCSEQFSSLLQFSGSYGSRGLSCVLVADMSLLESQITPSSPVPLSIKQLILPSQAVHKQPEYVRSCALSGPRSNRCAALFADRLTNTGKHHNIARFQKSTWIQHTVLCWKAT